MINWKKSSEINDCTVGELKSYFEKRPSSAKRIIRICEGCNMEQKICFQNHSNLCRKCAANTPKRRKAISNATIKWRAKEMDPLPPDQSIAIPENRNCSQYLGCLAEELLALTFKDIKRMPATNPGFDLICNRDFKIDVKSSATGYKDYWLFNIKKNTIANYFLCIAFESRDELIPVHVWLIPDKDINHLSTLTISKSTITKWSKYEQYLGQVLACCSVMRAG